MFLLDPLSARYYLATSTKKHSSQGAQGGGEHVSQTRGKTVTGGEEATGVPGVDKGLSRKGHLRQH